MKIMRGIGKAVKPLVNFPRWIGVGELRQSGKTIADQAKSLFTVDKASHEETYEEAIKRLGLTEEDVQRRMHALFRSALLYAGIGLVIFIYAIYLLIELHLPAGLLSLVLAALSFTLAFKEHFRYFQMRSKRLGCTLDDWLHATFKLKKGGSQ